MSVNKRINHKISSTTERHPRRKFISNILSHLSVVQIFYYCLLRLSDKSKNPSNFLLVGVSDNPWNLFEEIGILGYGTFAVVYKVRNRRDGKEYALKQTYRPPTIKEIKHCKREIEANSELVNPNVARYFGTFQDTSGKIYIQMELCGEDLGKCLENNELIETNIRPYSINIMEQLLRGLDYIHSKGLIHRDLKPSNIFVQIIDQNLFVKIGDFGLVSFKDDSKTSYTGSPLYRAPEQLSKSYDSKVDMYALGIDLFEVLKRVNEEEDTFDWSDNIRKLREDAELTLGEFEPYEPRGWKLLIRLLLQELPDQRPSASLILGRLQSILYDEASPVEFPLGTNGSGMISSSS